MGHPRWGRDGEVDYPTFLILVFFTLPRIEKIYYKEGTDSLARTDRHTQYWSYEMLAASATKTFEMYKMRCLYRGIFDLTNSNLADF